MTKNIEEIKTTANNPTSTHAQMDNPSMAPSADLRELGLLYELSQLLDNTTAYIEDTLDGALKIMARHFDMMRGSITLLSPQGDKMHIETAYGLNPIEKARGQYKAGEGVTGRVISTGKPMWVSQVNDEPLFLNRTQSRDLQKEQVSFLCVPIKFDNQVVGALSVDRLFAATQALEEDARLLSTIASMLARAVKVRQNVMVQKESAHTAPRPHYFVGNSEAMQQVYLQIEQVARSFTTVLIYGESGTGKELTAQAIHAASTRSDKPYISLNCAALPEHLMEIELLGYEKDAFIGAVNAKQGRLEMAHGGTLFLDEIGKLSLSMQAKVLRILQERCFERIGGVQTHKTDVRIIAATNCSLEDMIEQGSFSDDLYYRLNVFSIALEPLRERKDDIALMASYFMEKFAVANGRSNIRLSLAALDMLNRYDWPGNVRELQNIMERCILLVGNEGLILPQHLPPNLHESNCPMVHSNALRANSCPSFTTNGLNLQERLDALEYACIVESLAQCRGRLGNAASLLGLTERVMALRLRKHKINYKKFRVKRK